MPPFVLVAGRNSNNPKVRGFVFATDSTQEKFDDSVKSEHITLKTHLENEKI